MKLKPLDRSKPFQEVFGQNPYRYKQGNVIYGDDMEPLGTEGEPSKEEVAAETREAKLRAEIEAKVRAEMAAPSKTKTKGDVLKELAE